MQYMQNGGFHKNPLMRLTLWLTALLLAGFVVTNALLYFDKMDLTPSSVVSYYNGSEEHFRPARSYQSMLEVTHGHLAMMAFVLLLLTHLVLFTPHSKPTKVIIVVVAFLSGLFNEASSWLVRFVSADFAWLKIISFVSLEAALVFLLGSLVLFLFRAALQDSTNDEKPEPGSVNQRTAHSEYLFSHEEAHRPGT